MAATRRHALCASGGRYPAGATAAGGANHGRGRLAAGGLHRLVRERFAQLGGGPLPLPEGRTTPAAFDAFIRAEIAKWAEVVERTGVRPD